MKVPRHIVFHRYDERYDEYGRNCADLPGFPSELSGLRRWGSRSRGNVEIVEMEHLPYVDWYGYNYR